MISSAYSSLFKKTKKGKSTQVDPMAQFTWHQFTYFFIDNLRMTEEQVLDYLYVEALNWMAYFKTKKDQEEMANGRLA